MTNILDRDVPETDAELDRVLDQANSPEATPAESTEPPADDDADDADHEAPKINLSLTRRTNAPSRKGNQAWLDGQALVDFQQMMAAFAEAQYTRPEINEMTGMTTSAIWRAQNGKVHAGTELDTWMELFKLFTEGKLPPSAASLRAPKAADLKARITALEERLRRVTEVLSNEDAKTVKQLRELVEAAREVASV